MPQSDGSEQEYIECASSRIIDCFEEQGVNVETALSIILTTLLKYNLSTEEMKIVCDCLISMTEEKEKRRDEE